MKKTIALLALISIATPVAAFHRQTPPIVPITIGGETPLPRLAAGFERLVCAIDGSSGSQIFLCRHRHRDGIVLQQITTEGSNDNPTIAPRIGYVIAWDSDCDMLGCADPGRQIFEWANHAMLQMTHDPTGTSVNPTLGGQGNKLAWESSGDLAGILNGGVQQIFLRGADGVVTQVSRGNGTSRNASLDRSGRNLVYESTSDFNGNDSGVSQIWLLQADGSHAPITDGEGPSRRPAISPAGRLVVFDSTAALTTDGHDTTVSQIFVYTPRSGMLTQITNDPEGCSGASVARTSGDWRIGYVCHGEGFFHTLLADRTFRLPIPEGDTQQATVGFGAHFMTVSTTANLLGSGTTDGHQLYLLNLYKLPPEPLN